MSFTHGSKFIAPALPQTLLHRASLVSRLQSIIAGDRFEANKSAAAHYKLVLLCAPAGYGKTTLLADFAQHTNIPCCWYFLDSNDTDAILFLQNLLTSIRQRFPDFGTALDILLLNESSDTTPGSDDPRRFDNFIDALIIALRTKISESFALFLCNYHNVDENAPITHIINRLLQQLPPNCVLVIESRSTPSIEFATLLAHHQAIGWGSNMLRVTSQEILELANIQGVTPPSEAEAEQLAISFDGWIVGILLGTRLGDAEQLLTNTRTYLLQSLPFMRVEREKLFAYLVDEIFSRQPTVYAFLKEAAILQQMTPELCNALLNITNSAEHLERLVQQGMFVVCSDDGPQPIYTCHPILRELLCDDLRRHHQERFVELHHHAAEIFEAAGEYDEAIAHALAAGESSITVQLIIKAYELMAGKQHTETLLHWIDALPDETIKHHPQLLLIRTNIHLMKGEYTSALALLDTASTLLANMPPSDNSAYLKLRVEIMILRSKALFQTGEYQEAQELCQEVLEITPSDEAILRAEAYARLGICVSLLGQLSAGIEHLQKALHLWGRHTIRNQTADVHSALANAYGLIGNFVLAEHHISRAISYCDQLHDEKGKVNNLTRLATFKQRQGAFAEAENALNEGLAIAHGTPQFEREEGYVLVNLGSLYQDQGRYDQSLKNLENGLELARKVQDNYLINCCLCYLAMTYLLMDDPSTALLLISDTHLPEGGKMGYEQAIHDLTHGTVLSHQDRFEEALVYLTGLESSLKTSGLKRELLWAKLRIAACQLALKKQADAVQNLEEVTTILERQSFYEQLVLTGLKHLPELFRIVRTHPTLSRLRTLLHQEQVKSEVQEKKPQAQSSSADPLTTAATEPATLQVVAHPRLKVHAFGEPSVYINEKLVTRWRMARAMELFFFLLDCGRPMRKEQIITALWSQVDDQINQTFHSTIYYLRKALNEAYLVSQNGVYSLDLAAKGKDQVYYDVALFKEHYARAKKFLSNEKRDDAHASFTAMVKLYQGDYVQSFYSDWCSFQRDELRRIYLEARNHLAHIAWQEEAFDESAAHWQHMLAIDNCLEEAHYGLMRYYMRQGKRGLALRQYQRCVETLQEELSALPGQAIQSLHQRLIGTTEPTKKNGRATSPS
ncbi:tetratricopeptide repeat protein [Dictyobacter formicarum]|uniref:Bacterial transcriptional activator domain-containing protein n=1 Tax=Dictyobacter formicarum TaxID=2778368 RepID=A0ABQ3VVA1_9CHLR|nr:tetratricopeptide repeat protein [Dictyobacter formicarum]GHO89559.1 hypothetical protein KSZ_75650 [Dictyobacter formicarum]